MDHSLVEKFIEVTGEEEATAAQYLSLADGNLEQAISLLFESGGSAPSASAQIPVVNVDESEVRAPILPTQEVLVPPDVTCSFPRASNSIFDRFRDFAVETRRQEEEMMHRASGVRRSSRSSRQKRLEDLFRPPCDILFVGTFAEARDYAKSINRWLLVNVQNQQEFACQVLNRDVWPNEQIREIVKDHFVLWQVLSNSSDGKRYIDFYNVTDYPYLAIIDPRTGECMRSYNHISVDSLISGLNDMLSTHASPDNVESVPVKQTSTNMQSSMMSNSTVVTNIPSNSKRSHEHDKKAGCSSNSDNKDPKPSTSVNLINSTCSFVSKRSRIDEMGSKEQQMQKEMEEEEPVDPNVPTIKVCLRLPNGNKQTISISENDTVKGFIKKMEKIGYQSSEYTYLIPFPKTNIGELSMSLRLSDTILYPSNTVFITKI
ncbi:UBX domain-containing protein 7-like [Phymastichus coffea]|uniref:UBX domain-containing protein 7-like n=1 Tax=Phymastichus coffea TaxID=108790 RepID=UPI00273C2587|nr:UBX domain-containing protein 7-like [Phymastichus coffea]XP_058809585.1 UBX domain-containing protein 7-like [Phymastichus coffea]